MRAYADAAPRQFAEGIYTIGGGGHGTGITALINPKDVVLVTSVASDVAARATVRSLRELTSKPVKHIVVSGDAAAQKAALDALKEAYEQSDVMVAPGTIDASGRALRIEGKPGSLVVVVPDEQIRIERGGGAVRMK